MSLIQDVARGVVSPFSSTVVLWSKDISVIGNFTQSLQSQNGEEGAGGGGEK
jgi:hypothetical protein